MRCGAKTEETGKNETDGRQLCCLAERTSSENVSKLKAFEIRHAT